MPFSIKTAMTYSLVMETAKSSILNKIFAYDNLMATQGSRKTNWARLRTIGCGFKYEYNIPCSASANDATTLNVWWKRDDNLEGLDVKSDTNR